MKTCPHCAEEIQDAAVKCKHCGSELGEVKTSIRWGEAWGAALVVGGLLGALGSVFLLGTTEAVAGLIAIAGVGLVVFIMGRFSR